MNPDPKDTKARLDKALAEMRELQAKLKNLTPEQKERLAAKLRENAPHLGELKSRLEAAASVFADRKGALPDRLASRLAADSPSVSALRGLRSRMELASEWGQGWLVPVAHASTRKSLKVGKGVARFWAAVCKQVPEHAGTLAEVGAAWQAAPMMTIGALSTQVGSLLTEALGGGEDQGPLPADMALQILGRMVVEVQLQAGMDPSTTEGLDAFIEEAGARATGKEVEGDPKETALRMMLAFGWLTSALETTAG